METLKVVSVYAKMMNPFLAAILVGWVAYDLRHRFWRYVSGLLATALLVAYGLSNIFFG
jgi:hypothetical protein